MPATFVYFDDDGKLSFRRVRLPFEDDPQAEREELKSLAQPDCCEDQSAVSEPRSEGLRAVQPSK